MVLAASILIAIVSAVAESRSFRETKTAEFLVERAALGMGYEVAERFGIDDGFGPFMGLGYQRTPYTDLLTKTGESRAGLFGRSSSISQHLYLENEIDVRVEIVNDYSPVHVGRPKILISGNSAPSDEWYIQNLERHLDQVFRQFSHKVETSIKKNLAPQRVGG